MSSGRIQNIEEKKKFDEIVRVPNLTVVHFWAPWATQCEPMDEAMKILAEEEPDLKSVNFLRVEAEEQAEISMRLEVAAVPTFIFFNQGKLLKRIEGAKAADVTKSVKALAKLGNSAPQKPASESESELNERLKKLINSAPVLLFMKGNPGRPQCGFSRQTVELLATIDAKYETFDIFSDEAVRQGLKKYSNWPTYPQMYVNGDLIGGLDILK